MRRFASICGRRCAQSLQLRSTHITRLVDPNGFPGVLSGCAPAQIDKKLLVVPPATATATNLLLTGCANTGKLTTLMALGHELERAGMKVAWISADAGRAIKLGGLPMTAFLGLRAGVRELPIREQMEATFERHVRLMKDRYEELFLTLESADAIMFDSIHLADPSIVLAMDAVSRRVRGNEGEAFGGLRVHATANFWRMPVHLDSPYGPYAFQQPEWDRLFPRQVPTERVLTQDKELSRITHLALMGELGKDEIAALEATEPKDHFTPVVDNLQGFQNFTPKFPRQPSRRAMPPRAKQLRGNDFGAFLLSALSDGFFAHSFGLVERLSLNVGDRVHLTHSGNGIEAGSAGTVEDVMPFKIKVRFDGASSGVTSIPPMRCEVFHPSYPEIKYTVTQFPLFPRTDVSPMNAIKYGHVHGLSLDCGVLVDANDLGNLLAQTRSLSELHIVKGTIGEYVKLDGIVHEPTRIYHRQLLHQIHPQRKAAFERVKDQFCRNCKKHVPPKDFYKHWNTCVATQRWCPETDCCVPLEKWEAHNEKLQVVLCIDCGKALEWKNWELHRLSCNPMLREITTENDMLPTETRNSALALGYDRRDLHNMKTITKSLLPKTRKDLKTRSSSG